MKAVFVELPPFARNRSTYLSDDEFHSLQQSLMANPESGSVIKGSGGLRKTRLADSRRGKGKRGGLRVIYYWWEQGGQFWLFTLYDKDEMADLTTEQCATLKHLLTTELKERS